MYHYLSQCKESAEYAGFLLISGHILAISADYYILKAYISKCFLCSVMHKVKKARFRITDPGSLDVCILPEPEPDENIQLIHQLQEKLLFSMTIDRA